VCQQAVYNRTKNTSCNSCASAESNVSARAGRRIKSFATGPSFGRSKQMNAVIEEENTSPLSELCTVVVLYDDDATRARALIAGDYLIGQFWEDVELDFHWWRTDFLNDPCLAQAAASHAWQSDFLIICSQDPTEVSPVLEAWFELWISRRGGREGALVDLTLAPPLLAKGTRRELVLREIAERGGFDYLTATQNLSSTDSQRRPSAWSDNRTMTPYNTLDQSRPPSHFGLNE
jgi:hypothetical protein